jgi:hypothetical protein
MVKGIRSTPEGKTSTAVESIKKPPLFNLCQIEQKMLDEGAGDK